MFRDREPIAMRELKDVHCWIKMRCAVLPSKTTTFGLHYIYKRPPECVFENYFLISQPKHI